MGQKMYLPEGVGDEVSTPSGYYQPTGRASIEFEGRTVLYTSGTACVEASCCGTGSWEYLRVEGFVVDMKRLQNAGVDSLAEVETIEDEREKKALIRLLLERHPAARIEFR